MNFKTTEHTEYFVAKRIFFQYTFVQNTFPTVLITNHMKHMFFYVFLHDISDHLVTSSRLQRSAISTGLVWLVYFVLVPVVVKGRYSHGILSYFEHRRRNYREMEGNLKIILYKDRRTSEMIINHKGTRMVKDGEDWKGLQTTKLKNRGLTFRTVQPWLCSRLPQEDSFLILRKSKHA